MTEARDELRRLVDQLTEDQVPDALAEVQRVTSSAGPKSWSRAWFGAIGAHRLDVS